MLNTQALLAGENLLYQTRDSRRLNRNPADSSQNLFHSTTEEDERSSNFIRGFLSREGGLSQGAIVGERKSSYRVRALRGPAGTDCQVEVPVGISITTDDGKKIGELNNEGDKMRVARGGDGGGFRTDFLPSKGQRKFVRLDLKLIADVGLVGFPNAGKSSLLSSISHAKPAIADYPFTTLQPEVGKIMYPDYKQISVADLPGLIEGAHINKGMGHKFLKHVERTKQLLFVVDVTGFQLSFKTPFRTAFETVQLLILELELYKDELLDKPALLAVNKMDLPDAEDKFQELIKQLEDPVGHLHTLPEERIPDRQITFKHIIPISVATNRGIQELTRCIRRALHEEAELEVQESAKEKLRSLHSFPSLNVQ